MRRRLANAIPHAKSATERMDTQREKPLRDGRRYYVTQH